MNAFIVYGPAKNNQEKIEGVFEILEDAKSYALQLRRKYEAKGWVSWADRVKIRQPKSADAAIAASNELIETANEIQAYADGGAYGKNSCMAHCHVDAILDWVKILRAAA